MAIPIPIKLGQFEIRRKLGAGGMAEVFLAEKRGAEGTFKQLVVKRILPTHKTSPNFRTMFVEEAQLSTRLNHPNVVQVFEFFDAAEEGLLLSMEFVDGTDLGMLMARAKARGKRISPYLSAWMIAEAAKGLHYAHEKKDDSGAPLDIVHRDVSPQNILVSYEGHVKITDFGIASARILEDDDSVLKGKFGYMSPEQARGETAHRTSDIYSLGVVLWELLTGKPMHGGLGGEALLDIVRSGMVDAPSLYSSDIPSDLENVLMRALEPSASQRFVSAKDFSRELVRTIPGDVVVELGTVLETLIHELIPRESTKLLISPRTDPPPALPPSSLPLLRSPARRGSAREVRHVALVNLRLHGLDDLRHHDPHLFERTLERVRSTLGELAFKRGVRAWVWGDDQRAAAVAGLTSNATRSTSDAAWLALDTHEVLAGLSDDLPSPLSASIAIVRGIASGSRDSFGNLVRFRLHEPADYLSDTVLEATPVGITWVAGGVYRLARREFMWRDVPSIALEEGKRGDLPPSLAVYALDRALSPKEWQAVQETNDLVGRESEKIDLLDACHQAIGKSVVTARALVGEIGIGKTTLVDAFLAEANIARAVRIDCSPSRQDTPFSAVAELVRSLLQLKPEDPFETVAAAIRNAGGMASSQSGPESLHPIVQRLAEMVTERPVGGDEDDPMALRRQILSGLRSLLAALSLQQALVLVIEGLQWADRLSLEVLHELIVQQDPFPVLILLVSREDERVEFVLDGLIRIELRGLSADEQVHLVESRLGITKGVRAVCAEILPKVGGNPFFLLEMVDALLERGSLELREEVVGTKRIKALAKREGVQVVLPTTLEQLLGDRLHELPSEEQRVVDWLAVSGMPLSLVELSILVGESVEVAITRLCARGVAINTDDAIDFRHPLTRDVAYASLSFAERVQMHRALGELLAKGARHKGINAALVARHLMRGEAETQAAPYFFEAAIAARNGNQVALAARYFSRFTQTAMPGDPRLFDAHESLEGIYRLLGRRKDRVKHLEELRTLGKTQKIARFAIVALLRTSRFELDEGHLDTGLAIAKNAADAARLAKAPQYEAEGEALSSEFLRELGRVQEALVACDRALSACDPTNHPNVPPRLRAEVLRSRGVLLRRVGRVREAIAAYVESIAVFRKTDARRSEARAKHVLAFAMLCQGRYEDAVALAVDSIRIDLSIGGRFQLANTLTNIGHAYAKMGDYERAEAYLKRARGIHDSYGDQDGKADTLTVSAEILLEQGRLEEAEPFLRDADLLNEATKNAYDRVHTCAVYSAWFRRMGRFAEAQERAMVARQLAEKQTAASFHVLGQALEAYARIEQGDVQGATLLATTALGVEHLQGCEYGLEVRFFAATVLKKAGAPQADRAWESARAYAKELADGIRNPRLRGLFRGRPTVVALLGTYTQDLSEEIVEPYVI